MSDATKYNGQAIICVFCVAQFPHEPNDLCPTDEEEIEAAIASAIPIESRPVGRPQKDAGDMSDALSSGRKRAAETAPIPAGMVCEWSLLKEAGGGIYPITGCVGYPAEHRHHGPDKNTLNNELGVNLHRICTYCHNRWHAANNPTYSGERPKDDQPWLPDGEWQPHNPVDKLTIQECMVIEISRRKK